MSRTTAFVQERDMLLPRKPDHHAQAEIRCSVHEPNGWGGIDANCIQTRIGNGSEILADHMLGGKLIA